MATDAHRYARRRQALLDTLREKGIRDERVLKALDRVPRHLFVDTALQPRAYRDEALPIGLGQTISQPFTVAYQTAQADVQPGERVLEVGTGSGYQAAVLCELGARVYSIERHAPLLDRTLELLKKLGYRIDATHGDGTLGWPQYAPFDAIIVTAGGPEVPRPLLEQLAVGGRLIIPVGPPKHQVMNRIVRLGPERYERAELDVFRFVPLIGEG